VLYLANPSTPQVREAMTAGLLGCMTTPAQGNILPRGAWYACDNGKFGKGWPGHARWMTWLRETVERYGADRCLWAVAPDVPFDAAGTIEESRPWLSKIRALGIPAAFAAQDSCEDGLMPGWDEFDVLFLGGGAQCKPCGYEGQGWKTSPKARRTYCPTCRRRIYEWKESLAAADLAAEAVARGKKVHMGRVSSETRVRHAIAIGCSTKDGTYLRFGADENLPKLLGWYARMPKRQPPHVEFPLPFEEGGAA
jgi:hypothetical protein